MRTKPPTDVVAVNVAVVAALPSVSCCFAVAVAAAVVAVVAVPL